MKTDEVKTAVNVANELGESYMDLMQAIKGTTNAARSTKEVWRKGNHSILIKLGLALIAFPEPAVSDIVGTFLIAAGTVQEGIRRQTIYVEDVYKTFQKTLREIRATHEQV